MTSDEVIYIITIIPFVYLLSVLFLKILVKLYEWVDKWFRNFKDKIC